MEMVLPFLPYEDTLNQPTSNTLSKWQVCEDRKNIIFIKNK